MFNTVSIMELIKEAEVRKCPIWELVLEQEAAQQQTPKGELWRRMKSYWQVMSEAVEKGTQPGHRSLSGLSGQEGFLMHEYAKNRPTLSGTASSLAAARAMGVSVVNASMGKIVAAPTAGSCGILPAVLFTAAESIGASEKQIIGAIFTAAGLGKIIDEVASTSGAQGGCQAECGAAAGMAAAAAVEMAGGTPTQAGHAAALCLKSIMGLVCDPVAGLVEIPCIKRNAIGAANALLSADMALAGIESKIPIDEVIGAMREVGDLMPSALKETARGGLANTPTARALEKEIFG